MFSHILYCSLCDVDVGVSWIRRRYKWEHTITREELSNEFQRTRKSFTDAVKCFVRLRNLPYPEVFSCKCEV